MATRAANNLHVIHAGPAAEPSGLGPSGSQLWQDIMDEYEIADPASLCLLRLACQSLDRAEACRAHIDHDGEVVMTPRQGPKDHPLIKHEVAARSFCVRTLEKLGLSLEPVRPVGRPPSVFP